MSAPPALLYAASSIYSSIACAALFTSSLHLSTRASALAVGLSLAAAAAQCTSVHAPHVTRSLSSGLLVTSLLAANSLRGGFTWLGFLLLLVGGGCAAAFSLPDAGARAAGRGPRHVLAAYATALALGALGLLIYFGRPRTLDLSPAHAALIGGECALLAAAAVSAADEAPLARARFGRGVTSGLAVALVMAWRAGLADFSMTIAFALLAAATGASAFLGLVEYKDAQAAL